MTNQERIKEYLVGANGYLKSDISNGKVIMLSGKWGSGKTHFWQNKIATDELKKELKNEEKAYSYISLYGKSSIDEVENDIFGQVYIDAIGGENIVTKTTSTFTKLTKRYGGFSSILDFSKLAKAGENEQKDNIERIALKRLEKGGIICFDDFERKSKDIDLNDLFGFITQLTLNFECKVVIILNDDVFESEEKNIFSNVKEKTVSKFLNYNPTIKELFNLIYEKHKLYHTHQELEKHILKYLEEIKVLNARIYIQILDNISEWIDCSEIKYKTQEVLRCLVLVNINFILYHTCYFRDEEKKYKVKDWNDKLEEHSNSFNKIKSYARNFSSTEKAPFEFYENFNDYYNNFESKIIQDDKNIQYKEFLEENLSYYKSKYIVNYLDIAKNIDDRTFKKINNFIEVGILIKED